MIIIITITTLYYSNIKLTIQKPQAVKIFKVVKYFPSK